MANRRSDPRTAQELVEELAADPIWVARRDEKQAEADKHRAFLAAIEAPIVEEIRALGHSIGTIGDLWLTHYSYATAIPVLARWLSKVDNLVIEESIARALAVPAARSVTHTLIQEFEIAGDGLRWVIRDTLERIADDRLYGELARIASTERFGRARQMLVVALAKTTDPGAIPLLIRLLDDSDVQGHATIALGKLRARQARPQIEPFLKHEKAWIRTEARKALKRIDNATR